MRTVLIYAGTTEGRLLAEKLAAKGIASEVCVATEYGGQLMQSLEKSKLIRVRQGRLLPEQMRELLEEEDYLAVVDATHPYATLVTENVKRSILGMNVPYFRLAREIRDVEREQAPGLKKLIFSYGSAEECAKEIARGTGKVLLTTGSKELELFCEDEELRKRLIVRVLPGRESMELCWECGLEGRQIIAMQGPFTREMNLATIRQYGITALVTKESGKVGGMDEKLEAALEAEIPCHVIKPPAQSTKDAMSFDGVYEELIRLAEGGLPKKDLRGEEALAADEEEPENGKGEGADLSVVLAGIGMGGADSRSLELEKRLAETDYLFGAKRMTEGLTARKKIYNYYLEKDIIPCLKKIRKQNAGQVNVTILFSGDTGFYSGAERILRALRDVEGVKTEILPGSSTISALSARFGVRWHDAMIMSTHGVDPDDWKTEMLFGLRRGRKIFFLTSGPEDVRKIGELLEKYDLGKEYAILLGFQISYENEKLMRLNAGEARKIEAPGLYAGFLIKADADGTGDGKEAGRRDDGAAQKQAQRVTDEHGGKEKPARQITPGWKDEDFIRDKVPMTKEEVREVSICKLRLTEGAVVYDVGSGTGSIAMEIAALSPKIRVYAIECKAEAAQLLSKNRDKFGAYNVKVVEAMAPDGLDALPAPTHVFIGGSKGNLKGILDAIRKKNPGARIVMNAISLESIAQMQKLTKEYPISDLEVVNVSVSKARKVGEYHLMEANNPVTIFSFTLAPEEE